jgi:hypothetical protein
MLAFERALIRDESALIETKSDLRSAAYHSTLEKKQVESLSTQVESLSTQPTPKALVKLVNPTSTEKGSVLNHTHNRNLSSLTASFRKKA